MCGQLDILYVYVRTARYYPVRLCADSSINCEYVRTTRYPVRLCADSSISCVFMCGQISKDCSFGIKSEKYSKNITERKISGICNDNTIEESIINI